MSWLRFDLYHTLTACGVDVRAMNPTIREVLAAWLNGNVATSWFLTHWPLPGGSEPLESTACVVNSLAPMI